MQIWSQFRPFCWHVSRKLKKCSLVWSLLAVRFQFQVPTLSPVAVFTTPSWAQATTTIRFVLVLPEASPQEIPTKNPKVFLALASVQIGQFCVQKNYPGFCLTLRGVWEQPLRLRLFAASQKILMVRFICIVANCIYIYILCVCYVHVRVNHGKSNLDMGNHLFKEKKQDNEKHLRGRIGDFTGLSLCPAPNLQLLLHGWVCIFVTVSRLLKLLKRGVGYASGTRKQGNHWVIRFRTNIVSSEQTWHIL